MSPHVPVPNTSACEWLSCVLMPYRTGESAQSLGTGTSPGDCLLCAHDSTPPARCTPHPPQPTARCTPHPPRPTARCTPHPPQPTPLCTPIQCARSLLASQGDALQQPWPVCGGLQDDDGLTVQVVLQVQSQCVLLPPAAALLPRVLTLTPGERSQAAQPGGPHHHCRGRTGSGGVPAAKSIGSGAAAVPSTPSGHCSQQQTNQLCNQITPSQTIQ